MAREWILLLSLVIIVALHLAKAAAVPAIFIFGDSTADVGTNNYLSESLARADHRFNGIDFPYSIPTGRFSNGYNSVDLIVRLLGHKRSPPPFFFLLQRMSSFKSDSLQGVNFASGGSGILDATGKDPFKEVIPLGEQIKQFATVCGSIRETLGEDAADSLVSNALYLISVGSNDMFDYQLFSNHSISPQTFMTTLIDTYATHLKNLYNLGAKKFGIISVPPIGCCPFERVLNISKGGNGGCFEEMNEFALAFYKSIQDLLSEFSSEFKGMKYSLGNAYDMAMTIIDNPYTFGFKYTKEACCGKGTFNGEYPCNNTANLCSNRKEFMFWDRFHPTQAASNLAALTLYGGASKFVGPMNFSQLAVVDI